MLFISVEVPDVNVPVGVDLASWPVFLIADMTPFVYFPIRIDRNALPLFSRLDDLPKVYPVFSSDKLNAPQMEKLAGRDADLLAEGVPQKELL